MTSKLALESAFKHFSTPQILQLTLEAQVVKIDSSPLVRFYQKFEWASKSRCLLAQKVC